MLGEKSLQQVRKVVVVGAGTMGRGIAQVVAQAGCRVTLTDLSRDLLDGAVKGIREALEGGVERGKVTEEERDRALHLIGTSTEMEASVTDVDRVIEAVPENADLKAGIFRALDKACDERTILASNTSSLSVTELARVTSRASKVVGMHFFNPVHIMKLVELVVPEATSEETVDAARGLVEAMGKTAIVVTDSPGFASSRLGVVLGLEAMRMLEQEVASAEDIDHAMELGYKHPMGPLRLTDLVGLDVRLAIAEHLYDTLGGQQYRPPEILRRLVKEGKLGRKSGEGFYRWEE
ncbi:MAG: 3-hydroxyacyl-CoA dehydrogenase family protein [SAR324 cluster bacterium]|nr:3-hydroxyacyl-CoA dehydrogenase family protein [SAR324 cluster bacterium]